MLNLRPWGRAVLIVCALALTNSAWSQNFPSKSLRWIVGYPAGGGSDFLARTVGGQIASQINQAVVIDNHPGAGAIIGADLAAKAPADGYTIFTADNGVLIYNPVLYKKLPYDPVKDFAPIGLMARTPLLIVAAPTAGIHNAKELFELVRSKPGQLSYGSPGNGSPHHLAMELFKSKTGLYIVHVPYRGAAPAMQDVMSGQIQLMMVDASTAMKSIQAGRLIPLVTMSAQRLAQMPQVPTLAELGYKDTQAYAWQGLVAPAGTSPEVLARLQHEMQLALGNSEVQKRLREAAWEPVPSDGAALAAYVNSESRVWHKLIKERGITLE